ncbi:hypothetical protein C8R46DRAFT_1041125 [Mycena filopes]|nr:hypothetical protein C8R46DRAFT_1041125 [Mycena filopes]
MCLHAFALDFISSPIRAARSIRAWAVKQAARSSFWFCSAAGTFYLFLDEVEVNLKTNKTERAKADGTRHRVTICTFGMVHALAWPVLQYPFILGSTCGLISIPAEPSIIEVEVEKQKAQRRA